MPRMRALLALLLIVIGCGRGDAAAARSDAGATDTNQTPTDGRTEAADDETDTGSTEDAACTPCGYGHCPPRALCLTAPPLEPDVPIAMQDSATGGYDCAVSGSGNPSKSLYYALALPAQSWTHVVLTPVNASEPALLRVLSDCYATTVETSARNSSVTQGRAALCLFNELPVDRRVVIAAGSYAGTTPLTLAFDLSAETIDPNLGCVP